jgi:2-phosphosulfolactate phosphatase
MTYPENAEAAAFSPLSIQTFFSATEAESTDMTGKVAVVIDVIRATTVIVEALASGARGIFPTVTTEEAIALAQTLGREDALLCGERKGLRVEGFDLGNSPQEFTAERVNGKQLVMSTTNGTRSLRACQGARRVLIMAFTNIQAVVERVHALQVSEDASKLVLVCAGKEGRFALDDAVCAGLFLKALTAVVAGDAGQRPLVLDEGSRVAVQLADAFPLSEAFLKTTAAGAALVEVGLGDDLAWCARRDQVSLVPEMEDRVIRRSAAGAGGSSRAS